MERDGEDRINHREASGSHDPKVEKSILFKSTLTQILSRSLSPENIDSYADDALTDLIGLVSSVTAEYDKQQPFRLPPNKELEDKAFHYFGLNNIEEILSNVSSKAEEIKGLDTVIARAEKSSSVYIPPQQLQEPIHEGDGFFKDKSVISRTKTLLFILSNDFDVDVNDQEQMSLTTGVLTDNMMRKESYFMINVPKLSRTILSCDEEGNVTYIFDNAILADYGFSQADLANLTKKEINDFLHEDPSLGKRIPYSNRFVSNMINLITDLNINDKESSSQNLGHYLYPKAPEGVLSETGMEVRFNVARSTISKVLDELGDKLGETNTYKFGSQSTTGYTPQQQEMIRQELERRGNLSQPAPEGVLSVWGMRVSKELGVSDPDLINKVINELGDKLGETNTYKFGSNSTTGYTPAQQEMIRHKVLEVIGNRAQLAPEGVLSLRGMSKKFGGVDDGLINKVINELGDKLGETNTYKFETLSVTGYTPQQQEMIRQVLESRGFLSELATDEVLSLDGMSRSLGVSFETVKKVVKKLGDALGETKTYRFGSRRAIGHTPQQQEMIRQALNNKGLGKKNL